MFHASEYAINLNRPDAVLSFGKHMLYQHCEFSLPNGKLCSSLTTARANSALHTSLVSTHVGSKTRDTCCNALRDCSTLNEMHYMQFSSHECNNGVNVRHEHAPRRK